MKTLYVLNSEDDDSQYELDSIESNSPIATIEANIESDFEYYEYSGSITVYPITDLIFLVLLEYDENQPLNDTELDFRAIVETDMNIYSKILYSFELENIINNI